MNFDRLRVFDVTRCIVGKTVECPDLKINVSKLPFWSLLATRAYGRRVGLKDSFSKSGLGLSAFDFFSSFFIMGPY